jgi:hypothetical protein
MAAFFAPGIGFPMAAAAVAAVHAATGWTPGPWLTLHLAFVGGISQLVLGAGQFVAGAFLTTDPPRRPMLALLGILILATSRRGDLSALTGPASVALVGAYLALGVLVAARAARAVRAGPARI